ncbi:Phosphoenolpyruvate/pyruvate domain-containing protein [Lepidopterella palustris CBS 459.81]|uniref:Phosphoenolpyruvate/pyruvate domain-containing protein n=1 Tax=Lepidopterella palustris CBS 459.81 TaxID=1314670 RepID=A0A8E2E0N0_9PEZI|nr:Phosphoenolpyruvate/pyruvate domain-containing protein [Lepidopterella palustris CBS 459.81]
MYDAEKPVSGGGPSSTGISSSFLAAIKSNDGPILGTILSFPSILTAKIAARSGFQWAMIDMEHSPFTMQQATEIVHAVVASSQGSCLPLIRIPSQGTEWVKWALDTGAAGIIVPMVHTAADAEDLVQKALYPPRGTRSFGPYNAPFGDVNGGISFPDYYAKAQRRDVAVLPIVESREGVRNAEAILAVDGVTGVFVGPYDLRLSMGLPGGADGAEQEFSEAVEKICKAGKGLGKPIGSMGTGVDLSAKRTGQGMDFLLVSFDHNALMKGFRTDIENARAGVERAVKL